MRVALVTDSINFPSIPLMKLSAWHKSKGDQVTLIQDNFLTEKFDLCYVSKVFNLPKLKKISKLDYVPSADKYIFGGSGYAIKIEGGREIYEQQKDKPLTGDIEHIYPDYGLYGIENHAYGFMTRGCPNGCGFCIVDKKEGRCSRHVADLSEWWNGQKEIDLMDPNILACSDRERLIKQLIDSKAKINFNQGLDARFINDDIAQLVNGCNIKTVHFAFDLMKNEKAICKGLETFKRYSKDTDRELKVYILTNYNTTPEEDLYRVRKVIELGYSPDVRIYQKGAHPQFVGDLARWANNPYIYRSTSFENYEPRKGECVRDIYRGIL